MMIWWPAVIVLAAVHFCSGCVVGQLLRTPSWLRWLAFDKTGAARRNGYCADKSANFTVPTRRSVERSVIAVDAEAVPAALDPPASVEASPAGGRAEAQGMTELSSDLVDLPDRVKQLPPGVGEQRGETRYPATLAVLIRPLDDQLEPIEEYEGTTSDISRSGISIIQMHPATAKLLDAEIQIVPGERLRLLIEVRHQRRVGGFTVIGGRFLKKEVAPD